MKKLNTYELIGAYVRWVLHIEGLTISDYKSFLPHIKFLSVHAMHDHFMDSAHTEYDTTVCHLAEMEGFAAFGSENNGLSVIHYGVQNMHQKQLKSSPGNIKRPSEFGKDGKKPCFIWNHEFGCIKTEEEYGYGH